MKYSLISHFFLFIIYLLLLAQAISVNTSLKDLFSRHAILVWMFLMKYNKISFCLWISTILIDRVLRNQRLKLLNQRILTSFFFTLLLIHNLVIRYVHPFYILYVGINIFESYENINLSFLIHKNNESLIRKQTIETTMN